MPVPQRPARPHPGKPEPRLGDASLEGHVITYRCGVCHRTVHFLPSDLAQVFGPNLPALDPILRCSKCGQYEYIDVRLWFPGLSHHGSLIVRRPTEVIRTQKWRNEVLGDRWP